MKTRADIFGRKYLYCYYPPFITPGGCHPLWVAQWCHWGIIYGRAEGMRVEAGPKLGDYQVRVSAGSTVFLGEGVDLRYTTNNEFRHKKFHIAK